MAVVPLPARVAGYPTTAFFVLAWGISWCCWLPTVLGWTGVLAEVLFFAGVLGPAAAAAIVIRSEGGSLRLWLARPLYGASAAGPLLFVVFYTYLYNRTGSVLLCLLLHATFTPALELLVLVPARTYGRADLAAVVTAATLVAASVALVLSTRGRLGAAPPPAQSTVAR